MTDPTLRMLLFTLCVIVTILVIKVGMHTDELRDLSSRVAACEVKGQ